MQRTGLYGNGVYNSFSEIPYKLHTYFRKLNRNASEENSYNRIV